MTSDNTAVDLELQTVFIGIFLSRS